MAPGRFTHPAPGTPRRADFPWPEPSISPTRPEPAETGSVPVGRSLFQVGYVEGARCQE